MFSASSSLIYPTSLLFSSSLRSMSVTLAAEVNTPYHHLRSSRCAIRWTPLSLLFISLSPLNIFLLALNLLVLFHNGNNFGTVEEGRSHTITQYPAPPHPPLLSAYQFRWCSGPTQTVYQCRHWSHDPNLMRRHDHTRRIGNGPTDYLRERVRAQVLKSWM